ncbi:marine proteobacterial sortase target protein [Inquilinus sp. Marseille-Q2685]|uniref:marine proteobacterial sortase target protein n=1 Tax=Inquilinus sp. Marseille-Q2685 TaxID=2866581 RepID=UPI001CE43C16|nr:marine proteobacterial sortase target protein [Inquilinus sp. Marseille-Q2685]
MNSMTRETPAGLRPALRSRFWHAAPLLLSLLLAVLTLAVGGRTARAEAGPALVTPGEMQSGALLFRANEKGRYVEAPRLGTDVDLTVSGPTARAHVTQVFQNPTDQWVEAVYVYPLPEDGAVDTLKMVVGDRVITGDIAAREEARRTYEAAKQAGQTAGLVEQERPNLFTTSVANVGPGETVLIQIEYQESVHQSGDRFSLRVPLVVAPRYNPAPVRQSVDFTPGQGGWGQTTDPVPDRDRITPPVLDPRENAPVNPVTLKVRLQAGFPLGEVVSANHAVDTEAQGPDSRVITMKGPVPANRDFELSWTPAAGAAPSVGLFRERVAGDDYLLAFVTPPALQQADDKRPRDVVFVIDNSGSMGGASMDQAKASLLYALGRLSPADRFNVVRFDDTLDVLFPDVVPADAGHVGRAKSFVSALEASGGTEMVPAMQAALTDHGADGAPRLRQVVFLTDGAIGNEQQLFDTVAGMRGRSRVFMVGIGSAPNTYLMTRAAELGRGTFTQIGAPEQVEERMRSLFEKLESPVVTNLSARFSAGGADATPETLPDLYCGEPVVLAAKLAALSGTIEVKGMIGDRPWIVTLPVAQAAKGEGLSKLWARRRIADAEVAQTLGQISAEQADQRILFLALQHHLVTRLTSLVAVDRTPRRPEGTTLSRNDIPLNLPAGWDFDKVFGEARPKPEFRQAGLLLPAAARSDAPAAAGRPQPVEEVVLPQTATDAELRIIAGLLLLLAGLAAFGFGRRSKRGEA